MNILNSTKKDIPEIFRLYKLATEFQKEKFPQNQWPEFDKALIEGEVAENRQFKLMIDDKIACVWAIAYQDPEIWKDDDGVSSLYIHRIATNPQFRGNDFVKMIVAWAKEFGKDKKYIRMDTCGENKKLIQHYQKSGFDFLGIKKLENASGLPSHYHNADVCYFEIKL
ncbi:MAG TPA: GNAT family N-acetyltransferase [Sphingobacterium bovisgrunnientis]|nr:GNAT family N-acetyltransferase [Sphingobacterium bovisgrunnientis]